jgi:hypothetical protein
MAGSKDIRVGDAVLVDGKHRGRIERVTVVEVRHDLDQHLEIAHVSRVDKVDGGS